MKMILILIAFILAIVGLVQPKEVSRRWIIATGSLLVLTFIFQLVVELREVEDKAKDQYSGVLERCVLSSKEVVFPEIELGDSGTRFVYGAQGECPIFWLFIDHDLTIGVRDGQVYVSTSIRNRTGDVVAELHRNEWKVNRNRAFDRNYTKDALEVKDQTGDVVLQIKLVDGRVQFQGKFYDGAGSGVGFGKIRTPDGCRGAIEHTGPARPLNMRIDPIFQYPSELHLGELRH